MTPRPSWKSLALRWLSLVRPRPGRRRSSEVRFQMVRERERAGEPVGFFLILEFRSTGLDTLSLAGRWRLSWYGVASQPTEDAAWRTGLLQLLSDLSRPDLKMSTADKWFSEYSWPSVPQPSCEAELELVLSALGA